MENGYKSPKQMKGNRVWSLFTLKEFLAKAVDYDDFPWMYKDEQALKQMGE